MGEEEAKGVGKSRNGGKGEFSRRRERKKIVEDIMEELEEREIDKEHKK